MQELIAVAVMQGAHAAVARGQQAAETGPQGVAWVLWPMIAEA